tara:strand:+ start:67 stop:405 length:339 start_codon:yes stop_codon:yes gene_type:complete
MVTVLLLYPTSLKLLLHGVKLVMVHTAQPATVHQCQLVTVLLMSLTSWKSSVNGVLTAPYTVVAASVTEHATLSQQTIVLLAVVSTSVTTLIVHQVHVMQVLAASVLQNVLT